VIKYLRKLATPIGENMIKDTPREIFQWRAEGGKYNHGVFLFLMFRKEERRNDDTQTTVI